MYTFITFCIWVLLSHVLMLYWFLLVLEKKANKRPMQIFLLCTFSSTTCHVSMTYIDLPLNIFQHPQNQKNLCKVTNFIKYCIYVFIVQGINFEGYVFSLYSRHSNNLLFQPAFHVRMGTMTFLHFIGCFHLGARHHHENKQIQYCEKSLWLVFL